MAGCGCERLGQLSYRLDLSLWWQPQRKVELFVVDLGGQRLIKGSKSYYLRSISEAGETWARDIGALHDYLESHFRELRLSLSYFRDVPQHLAKKRAEQARQLAGDGGAAVVTAVDLARLQRRQAGAQQRAQSLQRLRGLISEDNSLLTGHLRKQADSLQQAGQRLEDEVQAVAGELSLLANLQGEYRRKGSAVALTFSISSNLQLASNSSELADLVAVVLDELRDADRYEVRQRLSGGRLRIQIAEAEEPELVWIEEWLGGALNPMQTERLLPELAAALGGHLEVTPDEDIRLDDHVKEHRKLVAPRAVSALLSRLDCTEHLGRETPLEQASLPLRLGRVMAGERLTDAEACLPLAQFRNGYVSGATGSGKTYLMRVLAEEACGQQNVSVLVLDPRNQAVGMLLPEDRPQILERYKRFNVPDPTGFPFKYCSPGLGLALPADLGTPGGGRHIVSLKGLDDAARCHCFADILEAVFTARSTEEADTVRLVILIEEAQLFTKRQVAPDARKEAERAEIALERCYREGRKYGLCTIVSSQSIKDFAYGSAAVRQNANTRFFLQNADRELEYARDHLDDPRQLVGLKPGEAIVCNPAWGSMTLAVRPPRSKVWELSDGETLDLVSGGVPRELSLSSGARQLLKVITEREAVAGHEGLNVGRLAEASGITSKRRLLALLEELEHAGFIRSRRLAQRGSPRVIEPVRREDRMEGGPEVDRSGQGGPDA